MPFPNGENSFIDFDETMNSSFNDDANNLKDVIGSTKGIKIGHININGLVSKREQLRLILTESKLDILCLNETKIDENIKDVDIAMPGFSIFRRDRNKHGGGVLIYVSSSLNSCKVKNINLLGFLEILWVKYYYPPLNLFLCVLSIDHHPMVMTFPRLSNYV
jgi:hypothetical protein